MPKRIGPGGPWLQAAQLDTPSIPDLDGSDSWWLGAQMGFASVPIAGAAAALALSVAIAGSFAFNDDIVPQPAVAELGVQLGERALYTPTLKQWEFVDELPLQALGVDEDSWSAPQAVPPVVARAFSADDEIVPPAVALGVDEEHWSAPQPAAAPPVARHFWADEEIGPQAAAQPAIIESGVQIGERLLHATSFKHWEFAEDLPTPATPLGVDEVYWLAPQPDLPQPVVRHFWFNDEVEQAPTSVAFGEGADFAQRLLHTPSLKQWEVADDLPQAAAPLGVDEDYWLAPQPALARPVLTDFWFNDEIKPVPDQQDAFSVANIGGEPLPIVFAGDEDIVPQAAPLGVDEAYWQVFTPDLVKPLVTVWRVEDERPEPPAPLGVEEDYWQVLTPPFVPPLVTMWTLDDEIGDFVAPPAVAAVGDGAVWPLPKYPQKKRVRERLPQDYERERKMVEEYLEALEKKTTASTVTEAPEQPTAAIPAVPRLTTAMARAAHLQELDVIAQHEAAAEADRARAEKERHKRRRAAAAVVMMLSF